MIEVLALAALVVVVIVAAAWLLTLTTSSDDTDRGAEIQFGRSKATGRFVRGRIWRWVTRH